MCPATPRATRSGSGPVADLWIRPRSPGVQLRCEIQVFIDGPRSASLPGRRTALTAPSRWRSDGARRKARPTDVNLLLTHSA